MLRAHLRSAQEAAQQLLSDAEETPPQGWEPLDAQSAREQSGQLHSLSELVRSIREMLPEDVLAELADLIRALINVLRALLEVMLSRLEPRQPEPREEVQDIPIV